tara:strand:- start:245 stop:1501 length:1257 start_codon:yes stop_codon:yes gene_type:complete
MQERADKTAAEGREWDNEQRIAKVTDAQTLLETQADIAQVVAEDTRKLKVQDDKREIVSTAITFSRTLPLDQGIRHIQDIMSNPDLEGYTSGLVTHLAKLKTERQFDSEKRTKKDEFYSLVSEQNIARATAKQVSEILGAKDSAGKDLFTSTGVDDFWKIYYTQKNAYATGERAEYKIGLDQTLDLALARTSNEHNLIILREKMEAARIKGTWTDTRDNVVYDFSTPEAKEKLKRDFGRELQIERILNNLLDRSMLPDEGRAGSDLMSAIVGLGATKNNIAPEDITDKQKYEWLSKYFQDMRPEMREEKLQEMFNGSDENTIDNMRLQLGISVRTPLPKDTTRVSAGLGEPPAGRPAPVSLSPGTKLQFLNRSWSVTGVKRGDENKEDPLITIKSDETPPKTMNIPLSVLKAQANVTT